MYSSEKQWHKPTSAEIKRHQLEATIRGNVITVRNKIDDLKEKFDRFDVYKEKRKEQLSYFIAEINKIKDEILEFRINEELLAKREIPLEDEYVFKKIPKALEEAENEKVELLRKRDELQATYKKLKTKRDNYEQKIIDKHSHFTPYDQMEGKIKKRHEDEDKSIEESVNRYKEYLEKDRDKLHEEFTKELREIQKENKEYIEEKKVEAREERTKEIQDLLDSILNDTQKEDDIQEKVDEFMDKCEEQNVRFARLDNIIEKRKQDKYKAEIRKRAEAFPAKKETFRIDNNRLNNYKDRRANLLRRIRHNAEVYPKKREYYNSRFAKLDRLKRKYANGSVAYNIRQKAKAFPNKNNTVNKQIDRLEAIKEQRKEEVAQQARQQAEQERQQRDYLERQELAQFLENQRQQQAAENLRRQQEEERQQREQQEARELAERQRQQREQQNQMNTVVVPKKKKRVKRNFFDGVV